MTDKTSRKVTSQLTWNAANSSSCNKRQSVVHARCLNEASQCSHSQRPSDDEPLFNKDSSMVRDGDPGTPQTFLIPVIPAPVQFLDRLQLTSVNDIDRQYSEIWTDKVVWLSAEGAIDSAPCVSRHSSVLNVQGQQMRHAPVPLLTLLLLLLIRHATAHVRRTMTRLNDSRRTAFERIAVGK